jgi:hypothetical protein
MEFHPGNFDGKLCDKLIASNNGGRFFRNILKTEGREAEVIPV